jgi:hypothetical protein
MSIDNILTDILLNHILTDDNLTPSDVWAFSATNRYYRDICNENFFEKLVKRRYSINITPVETFKNFYINHVSIEISAEIFEQNIIYELNKIAETEGRDFLFSHIDGTIRAKSKICAFLKLKYFTCIIAMLRKSYKRPKFIPVHVIMNYIKGYFDKSNLQRRKRVKYINKR